MKNINSFSAFARSIQRATGYSDLRPRLRQVLLGEDPETTDDDDRDAVQEPQSLPGQSGSANGEQSAHENTPLLDNGKNQDLENLERTLTPLRSTLDDPSLVRVQTLTKQRDESRAQMKDDEREPLYITRVHREDGTVADVIVGQSTLPQTIFNSCNVLVGVALLSLPLGIRYAGWVLGLAGLMATSLLTRYTAGMLSKCMDVDSSLANFGDIAFVAFGEKGRVSASILITLELLITCVGLVILFADTLRSLIDGPSLITWKILCGCILLPLTFVPMRFLGYTSFLGIFCNILIVVVAFVAGFLKPHSPGSLREVAVTYAFPTNWKALPLSFGLLMGKYIL